MPTFEPISWDSERIACFAAVRAWECGSGTLWRIWNKHKGSVDEFLRDPGAWKRLQCTDVQQAALRASSVRLDQAIEELDRENIRFTLPWDPEFPSSLTHIPDPPAAIFIRGEVTTDALRVAIVGTRKATSYGRRSASELARDIGEAGVDIVSGLAFGIDEAAHLGALACGARTIGVIPCGVSDRSVVPHSHLKLAHRIIEHRGALISEHAPDTPTLPYQYLHRNRLIAGLSQATIIVEADIQSGALTTAKLALEQGADVLAVPGSIYSPVSRGTHALIRDGAKPCTCAADVLELRSFGSAERIASMNATRSSLPMSAAEHATLDALTEPMDINAIVRKTGRHASDVNSTLTTLELKGYVVRQGQEYVRVNNK
ncbi:MAG: DNA-processing protein DprA [Patescibacteria group bacterium]